MPYDIIIGRDESDKKEFENKGLVYIGKGFVKMGQYTSLSNKIFLDVIRTHVVLIAGKRGSGKSYTIGVFAEQLADLPKEVSQNIASIIFDTMGIYWTMKYQNEKDRKLLEEWGLTPKNLPVKIFVPYGHFDEYEEKGVPVDKKFALDVTEMSAEDWIMAFELELINPVGVLIQTAIVKLKEDEEKYFIEDIIKEIEKDANSSRDTKNAAIGLFQAADSWGIFARKGTKQTNIIELVSAGKTTVLDLSVYRSIGAFNVRALVVSLVSRKLFEQRMTARKKEEIDSIVKRFEIKGEAEKKEMPLIWMFIDECLARNTEIITDKAHTPIQEIVKKFENKEKINILGYDTEKNEFSNYPVTNVFKKGKRKVMKLTTETGREITCTPEHRVLTRISANSTALEKPVFASAFSVKEIATPIAQHYSKNLDCVKARLLGHLFGDGWATEKTKSLGFSGKINPDDLNKIKEDLSILGLKSSNIFSRNTNSKITNNQGKTIEVKGKSHCISASYNAYRYFDKLEIIKGDKIIQPTKIPNWIKTGNNKIKAEFLAALMGSDGQKITKAKNAKGDFNAIRFSFNKLQELEKQAFEYANEIKKLFESLNVKISSITKKPGNIRKNGDKTIKIVITLKKNLPNIINFLEKIGYRYCAEKETNGINWLAYLKARLFLKNEREKFYNKIHDLHKQGLGKTKISKIIGFPEAQVRDWLYMGIKPGLPKNFPDIDEWINNRKKENLLFEKVFRIEDFGEEEVYDISVEKVHNFISNGLITHNCHEFLPLNKKTIATDALVQLLREGRQPGISMILATQQPGKIHRDVMTQSDIVLSHKLTSKQDLTALNHIMQSYMFESISQYMNELPNLKGSGIILDDTSERIYPMRIHPRFTWHGGEAPTSIKREKKI